MADCPAGPREIFLVDIASDDGAKSPLASKANDEDALATARTQEEIGDETEMRAPRPLSREIAEQTRERDLVAHGAR